MMRTVQQTDQMELRELMECAGVTELTLFRPTRLYYSPRCSYYGVSIYVLYPDGVITRYRRGWCETTSRREANYLARKRAGWAGGVAIFGYARRFDKLPQSDRQAIIEHLAHLARTR